jgi:toxin ParE1/3/4
LPAYARERGSLRESERNGSSSLHTLAEDDLYEIAVFTIKQWSAQQADSYLAGLEEFCELISGFPGIGRECDEISPGLRRMEHKSHVVFFFPAADGITISRILHKSRDISDEEFEEFS